MYTHVLIATDGSELAQKGAGLESVIPKTVETASDVLVAPLRLMSRRLSVKVPLPILTSDPPAPSMAPLASVDRLLPPTVSWLAPSAYRPAAVE